MECRSYRYIPVALGMAWVMVVALSNPLQIAAIPTAGPLHATPIQSRSGA